MDYHRQKGLTHKAQCQTLWQFPIGTVTCIFFSLLRIIIHSLAINDYDSECESLIHTACLLKGSAMLDML